MKHIISALIIGFYFFNTLSVEAKKLNAVFSYASFYNLDDGPYLETYLSVNGRSVNFVITENNTYQAAIEIVMIFKENDTIKSYSKYELLSPEIQDTLETNFNFLDLQRFLLPNGKYDLELYITDKNSDNKPFFATDFFEIGFPKDTISISDIQFVESLSKTDQPNILTKAGYDLIPYIINFHPQSVEKITFYAEIYNTNEVLGIDAPFVLTYYIEPWETQNPLPKFKRIKREVSKNINAVLGDLLIKDLPSGNYNFVLEVRDRENNTIVQKKSFFYRSNPNIEYNIDHITENDVSLSFAGRINNRDTLEDFIRSLYPISTEMERVFASNAIRRRDLGSMQKFFYNFWFSRSMLNAENEWKSYYKNVQMVNNIYGTRIHKGYETDRGRVYLQYGIPNSIAKSDFEPSAYPYEIWHYYSLGNQTNRRFVFYLREFATNNYELIHSDALGEINDPRWQIKVHKRDSPSHSLDPEEGERHWGGRIDDYFRNPR